MRLTRRKEAGRVEVPEDAVAVDEDEDGRPEDTPVGQVGLQAAVVNQFGPVEALGLHATVCGAKHVRRVELDQER